MSIFDKKDEGFFSANRTKGFFEQDEQEPTSPLLGPPKTGLPKQQQDFFANRPQGSITAQSAAAQTYLQSLRETMQPVDYEKFTDEDYKNLGLDKSKGVVPGAYDYKKDQHVREKNDVFQNNFFQFYQDDKGDFSASSDAWVDMTDYLEFDQDNQFWVGKKSKSFDAGKRRQELMSQNPKLSPKELEDLIAEELRQASDDEFNKTAWTRKVKSLGFNDLEAGLVAESLISRNSEAQKRNQKAFETALANFKEFEASGFTGTEKERQDRLAAARTKAKQLESRLGQLSDSKYRDFEITNLAEGSLKLRGINKPDAKAAGFRILLSGGLTPKEYDDLLEKEKKKFALQLDSDTRKTRQELIKTKAELSNLQDIRSLSYEKLANQLSASLSVDGKPFAISPQQLAKYIELPKPGKIAKEDKIKITKDVFAKLAEEVYVKQGKLETPIYTAEGGLSSRAIVKRVNEKGTTQLLMNVKGDQNLYYNIAAMRLYKQQNNGKLPSAEELSQESEKIKAALDKSLLQRRMFEANRNSYITERAKKLTNEYTNFLKSKGVNPNSFKDFSLNKLHDLAKSYGFTDSEVYDQAVATAWGALPTATMEAMLLSEASSDSQSADDLEEREFFRTLGLLKENVSEQFAAAPKEEKFIYDPTTVYADKDTLKLLRGIFGSVRQASINRGAEIDQKLLQDYRFGGNKAVSKLADVAKYLSANTYAAKASDFLFDTQYEQKIDAERRDLVNAISEAGITDKFLQETAMQVAPAFVPYFGPAWILANTWYGTYGLSTEMRYAHMGIAIGSMGLGKLGGKILDKAAAQTAKAGAQTLTLAPKTFAGFSDKWVTNTLGYGSLAAGGLGGGVASNALNWDSFYNEDGEFLAGQFLLGTAMDGLSFVGLDLAMNVKNRANMPKAQVLQGTLSVEAGTGQHWVSIKHPVDGDIRTVRITDEQATQIQKEFPNEKPVEIDEVTVRQFKNMEDGFRGNVARALYGAEDSDTFFGSVVDENAQRFGWRQSLAAKIGGFDDSGLIRVTNEAKMVDDPAWVRFDGKNIRTFNHEELMNPEIVPDAAVNPLDAADRRASILRQLTEGHANAYLDAQGDMTFLQTLRKMVAEGEVSIDEVGKMKLTDLGKKAYQEVEAKRINAKDMLAEGSEARTAARAEMQDGATPESVATKVLEEFSEPPTEPVTDAEKAAEAQREKSATTFGKLFYGLVMPKVEGTFGIGEINEAFKRGIRSFGVLSLDQFSLMSDKQQQAVLQLMEMGAVRYDKKTNSIRNTEFTTTVDGVKYDFGNTGRGFLEKTLFEIAQKSAAGEDVTKLVGDFKRVADFQSGRLGKQDAVSLDEILAEAYAVYTKHTEAGTAKKQKSKQWGLGQEGSEIVHAAQIEIRQNRKGEFWKKLEQPMPPKISASSLISNVAANVISHDFRLALNSADYEGQQTTSKDGTVTTTFKPLDGSEEGKDYSGPVVAAKKLLEMTRLDADSRRVLASMTRRNPDATIRLSEVTIAKDGALRISGEILAENGTSAIPVGLVGSIKKAPVNPDGSIRLSGENNIVSRTRSTLGTAPLNKKTDSAFDFLDWTPESGELPREFVAKLPSGESVHLIKDSETNDWVSHDGTVRLSDETLKSRLTQGEDSWKVGRLKDSEVLYSRLWEPDSLFRDSLTEEERTKFADLLIDTEKQQTNIDSLNAGRGVVWLSSNFSITLDENSGWLGGEQAKYSRSSDKPVFWLSSKMWDALLGVDGARQTDSKFGRAFSKSEIAELKKVVDSDKARTSLAEDFGLTQDEIASLDNLMTEAANSDESVVMMQFSSERLSAAADRQGLTGAGKMYDVLRHELIHKSLKDYIVEQTGDDKLSVEILNTESMANTMRDLLNDADVVAFISEMGSLRGRDGFMLHYSAQASEFLANPGQYYEFVQEILAHASNYKTLKSGLALSEDAIAGYNKVLFGVVKGLAQADTDSDGAVLNALKAYADPAIAAKIQEIQDAKRNNELNKLGADSFYGRTLQNLTRAGSAAKALADAGGDGRRYITEVRERAAGRLEFDREVRRRLNDSDEFDLAVLMERNRGTFSMDNFTARRKAMMFTSEEFRNNAKAHLSQQGIIRLEEGVEIDLTNDRSFDEDAPAGYRLSPQGNLYVPNSMINIMESLGDPMGRTAVSDPDWARYNRMVAGVTYPSRELSVRQRALRLDYHVKNNTQLKADYGSELDVAVGLFEDWTNTSFSNLVKPLTRDQQLAMLNDKNPGLMIGYSPNRRYKSIRGTQLHEDIHWTTARFMGVDMHKILTDAQADIYRDPLMNFYIANKLANLPDVAPGIPSPYKPELFGGTQDVGGMFDEILAFMTDIESIDPIGLNPADTLDLMMAAHLHAKLIDTIDKFYSPDLARLVAEIADPRIFVMQANLLGNKFTQLDSVGELRRRGFVDDNKRMYSMDAISENDKVSDFIFAGYEKTQKNLDQYVKLQEDRNRVSAKSNKVLLNGALVEEANVPEGVRDTITSMQFQEGPISVSEIKSKIKDRYGRLSESTSLTINRLKSQIDNPADSVVTTADKTIHFNRPFVGQVVEITDGPDKGKVYIQASNAPEVDGLDGRQVGSVQEGLNLLAQASIAANESKLNSYKQNLEWSDSDFSVVEVFNPDEMTDAMIRSEASSALVKSTRARTLYAMEAEVAPKIDQMLDVMRLMEESPEAVDFQNARHRQFLALMRYRMAEGKPISFMDELDTRFAKKRASFDDRSTRAYRLVNVSINGENLDSEKIPFKIRTMLADQIENAEPVKTLERTVLGRLDGGISTRQNHIDRAKAKSIGWQSRYGYAREDGILDLMSSTAKKDPAFEAINQKQFGSQAEAEQALADAIIKFETKEINKLAELKDWISNNGLKVEVPNQVSPYMSPEAANKILGPAFDKAVENNPEFEAVAIGHYRDYLYWLKDNQQVKLAEQLGGQLDYVERQWKKKTAGWSNRKLFSMDAENLTNTRHAESIPIDLINENNFRHNAETWIHGLDPKTGRPHKKNIPATALAKDWVNILEGNLTKDELLWTGHITDWLNSDPSAKLSREQILEYLKENRITMGVTHFESTGKLRQNLNVLEEKFRIASNDLLDASQPLPYKTEGKSSYFVTTLDGLKASNMDTPENRAIVEKYRQIADKTNELEKQVKEARNELYSKRPKWEYVGEKFFQGPSKDYREVLFNIKATDIGNTGRFDESDLPPYHELRYDEVLNGWVVVKYNTPTDYTWTTYGTSPDKETALAKFMDKFVPSFTDPDHFPGESPMWYRADVVPSDITNPGVFDALRIREIQGPHFQAGNTRGYTSLEVYKELAKRKAENGEAYAKVFEAYNSRPEFHLDRYSKSTAITRFQDFKSAVDTLVVARMENRQVTREEALSSLIEDGTLTDFATENMKGLSLNSAMVSDIPGYLQWGEEFVAARDREQNTKTALAKIVDDMRQFQDDETSPVPQVPFTKTWHKVLIKHAIMQAAEQGLNKVLLTPADIQADVNADIFRASGITRIEVYKPVYADSIEDIERYEQMVKSFSNKADLTPDQIEKINKDMVDFQKEMRGKIKEGNTLRQRLVDDIAKIDQKIVEQTQLANMTEETGGDYNVVLRARNTIYTLGREKASLVRELSKVVNNTVISETADPAKQTAVVKAYDKTGNLVMTHTVPVNGKTTIGGREVGLNSLLGSSIAKQIRDDGRMVTVLSGENMTIGASFYENLYNGLGRKAMEEIADQFGAEFTKIPVLAEDGQYYMNYDISESSIADIEAMQSYLDEGATMKAIFPAEARKRDVAITDIQELVRLAQEEGVSTVNVTKPTKTRDYYSLEINDAMRDSIGASGFPLYSMDAGKPPADVLRDAARYTQIVFKDPETLSSEDLQWAIQKGYVGIVSADLSSRTPEENEAAFAALKAELEVAGLKTKTIVGRYTYREDGVQSQEKSLLVITPTAEGLTVAGHIVTKPEYGQEGIVTGERGIFKMINLKTNLVEETTSINFNTADALQAFGLMGSDGRVPDGTYMETPDGPMSFSITFPEKDGVGGRIYTRDEQARLDDLEVFLKYNKLYSGVDFALITDIGQAQKIRQAIDSEGNIIPDGRIVDMYNRVIGYADESSRDMKPRLEWEAEKARLTAEVNKYKSQLVPQEELDLMPDKERKNYTKKILNKLEKALKALDDHQTKFVPLEKGEAKRWIPNENFKTWYPNLYKELDGQPLPMTMEKGVDLSSGTAWGEFSTNMFSEVRDGQIMLAPEAFATFRLQETNRRINEARLKGLGIDFPRAPKKPGENASDDVKERYKAELVRYQAQAQALLLQYGKQTMKRYLSTEFEGALKFYDEDMRKWYDRMAEIMGRDPGTLFELMNAWALAATSGGTAVQDNARYALNFVLQLAVINDGNVDRVKLPFLMRKINEEGIEGFVLTKRDQKPSLFGMNASNLIKMLMAMEGYVPKESLSPSQRKALGDKVSTTEEILPSLSIFEGNTQIGRIIQQGLPLGDDPISMGVTNNWVYDPNLANLVKEKGRVAGMMEYLLTPDQAGRFNAQTVMGEKLGSFFMNLAGFDQPVTIDRWMARWFRTVLGTDVSASTEKGSDEITWLGGGGTKGRAATSEALPEEYYVYSGLTTKIARELSQELGREVTPRDVQQAIWVDMMNSAYQFTAKADKVNEASTFVDHMDVGLMQTTGSTQPKLTSSVSSEDVIKNLSRDEMPPILQAYSDKDILKANFFLNLNGTPGLKAYVNMLKGRDASYASSKLPSKNQYITGVGLYAMDSESLTAQQHIINLAEPLLKEADADAWIGIAERLVAGNTAVGRGMGRLADTEKATIKALAEKKDLDGLQKYVLSLNKQTPLELLVNVSRVALLIGYKNIVKNIAGNGLRQVMDEVSRVPASVLDTLFIQVNKALGGSNFDRSTTSIMTNPARTLQAYAKAFGKAATEGAGDFIDVLRGIDESVIFEHPSLFRERTTGWKILKPLEVFEKYGWRFQGAMDKPFNAAAFYRSLHEMQKFRHDEQLKAGNKIPFEEAEQFLTPADYQLAEQYALMATYQKKNVIADKYYGIIDGLPPTWRAIISNVVKFVKTPVNVADYILDYSGIWQIAKLAHKEYNTADWVDWKSSVKRVLDNPADRKTLSMAISQGAIGTVMFHVGYRMAEAGMLSAFYSREDRREEEQMQAKGTSWGKVNIGGYSVDISWLSPNSYWMVSGATAFEAQNDWTRKKSELEAELAKATEESNESKITTIQEDLRKHEKKNPTDETITRLIKNFALQTPFLRQADDVVTAWNSNNMLKTLGGLWVTPEAYVPAIVKEIAEAKDQYERVITDESYGKKALAKIQKNIPTLPGLSNLGQYMQSTELPAISQIGAILSGRENLPIRYDMFGRPVEAPQARFGPLRGQQMQYDLLTTEMDRLNLSITTPEGGTTVSENELRKQKGDIFRPVLDTVVNSPQYAEVNDEFKKRMLQYAMRDLTGEMKRDKRTQEEEKFNLGMMLNREKFKYQLKTSPEQFIQPRTITDKEILRIFVGAGLDPKVSMQTLINDIRSGGLDSFIDDKFMYDLMVTDKRGQSDTEVNYQEFMADPQLALVRWWASDKRSSESRERVRSRREELRREGKSEQEIEKIIRKEAARRGAQTRIKLKRFGAIEIE